MALRAWWKLNNDYVDASANAFNGTAAGSGNSFSTTRKEGSHSLSTDGSGYFTAGNNLNLARTDTITISLWIKKSTEQNFEFLVGKSSDPPNDSIGWAIFTSTTRIYFQMLQSVGVGLQTSFIAGAGYTDGNWHNIIVTYDGSSTPGGVLMYLDNSALGTQGTDYNTLTSDASNSVNLSVGGAAGGGSIVLTSLIDSVKIDDHVWTSDERATEVNTPDGPPVIDVFDSITVSESVTVSIDLDISINDAVTAAENIAIDNANLGDISVNDAVTVSESISLDNLSLGDISVFDAITISESVEMDSPIEISISDSVVVSESISIENTNLGGIDVNDAITIAENIATGGVDLGDISVNDAVIVSESISAQLDLGDISVFDSITVSESASVRVDLGDISVIDAITVSENISVLVSAARRGLVVMRSTEQSSPIPMSSTQQGRPITLDDNRIM